MVIILTGKDDALPKRAARRPARLLDRVGLPPEDLTRLRDAQHELVERLRGVG